MATVTIARNSFARSDTVRESIPNKVNPQGCTWCGSKPRTLYRYGEHRDGINTRPEFSKGEFCGKGCHSSYHGS